MEVKEIKLALKKCGVKKNDTIMLHGDGGVAAQLKTNDKNKLSRLFDEIIKYLGKNGTLLVPTYTYNVCKKKYFDVEKTPSELGLFSEYFRKRNKVYRTLNPIFSFAIYGKKIKYFKKSKYDTCFGKDSVFDLFNRINGKIVCLGCDIDRITFTHYVEEFHKINYRFFKKFKIKLKYKKKIKNILSTYFVRKKNIKNKINLKKLYDFLKKNKKIKETEFGRYNILSIKAKTFFDSCIILLKKNRYSLINSEK